MQGLNRVVLIGNVGADPELRHTQNGTPILNIRLATSETYLDRDKVRQERTDWHSVTVWGKRGEALSQYVRKGSMICVEGSLRTSSYEAKDGGGKRYKTEVNASNVVLLGDRMQGGGGGGHGGSGGGYSGGGGGGQTSSQTSSPAPVAADPMAGDDDIPF